MKTNNGNGGGKHADEDADADDDCNFISGIHCYLLSFTLRTVLIKLNYYFRFSTIANVK